MNTSRSIPSSHNNNSNNDNKNPTTSSNDSIALVFTREQDILLTDSWSNIAECLLTNNSNNNNQNQNQNQQPRLTVSVRCQVYPSYMPPHLRKNLLPRLLAMTENNSNNNSNDNNPFESMSNNGTNKTSTTKSKTSNNKTSSHSKNDEQSDIRVLAIWLPLTQELLESKRVEFIRNDLTATLAFSNCANAIFMISSHHALNASKVIPTSSTSTTSSASSSSSMMISLTERQKVLAFKKPSERNSELQRLLPPFNKVVFKYLEGEFSSSASSVSSPQTSNSSKKKQSSSSSLHHHYKPNFEFFEFFPSSFQLEEEEEDVNTTSSGDATQQQQQQQQITAASSAETMMNMMDNLRYNKSNNGANSNHHQHQSTTAQQRGPTKRAIFIDTFFFFQYLVNNNSTHHTYYQQSSCCDKLLNLLFSGDQQQQQYTIILISPFSSEFETLLRVLKSDVRDKIFFASTADDNTINNDDNNDDEFNLSAPSTTATTNISSSSRRLAVFAKRAAYMSGIHHQQNNKQLLNSSKKKTTQQQKQQLSSANSLFSSPRETANKILEKELQATVKDLILKARSFFNLDLSKCFAITACPEDQSPLCSVFNQMLLSPENVMLSDYKSKLYNHHRFVTSIKTQRVEDNVLPSTKRSHKKKNSTTTTTTTMTKKMKNVTLHFTPRQMVDSLDQALSKWYIHTGDVPDASIDNNLYNTIATKSGSNSNNVVDDSSNIIERIDILSQLSSTSALIYCQSLFGTSIPIAAASLTDDTTSNNNNIHHDHHQKTNRRNNILCVKNGFSEETIERGNQMYRSFKVKQDKLDAERSDEQNFNKEEEDGEYSDDDNNNNNTHNSSSASPLTALALLRKQQLETNVAISKIKDLTIELSRVTSSKQKFKDDTFVASVKWPGQTFVVWFKFHSTDGSLIRWKCNHCQRGEYEKPNLDFLFEEDDEDVDEDDAAGGAEQNDDGSSSSSSLGSEDDDDNDDDAALSSDEFGPSKKKRFDEQSQGFGNSSCRIVVASWFALREFLRTKLCKKDLWWYSSSSNNEKLITTTNVSSHHHQYYEKEKSMNLKLIALWLLTSTHSLNSLLHEKIIPTLLLHLHDAASTTNGQQQNPNNNNPLIGGKKKDKKEKHHHREKELQQEQENKKKQKHFMTELVQDLVKLFSLSPGQQKVAVPSKITSSLDFLKKYDSSLFVRFFDPENSNVETFTNSFGMLISRLSFALDGFMTSTASSSSSSSFQHHQNNQQKLQQDEAFSPTSNNNAAASPNDNTTESQEIRQQQRIASSFFFPRATEIVSCQRCGSSSGCYHTSTFSPFPPPTFLLPRKQSETSTSISQPTLESIIHEGLVDCSVCPVSCSQCNNNNNNNNIDNGDGNNNGSTHHHQDQEDIRVMEIDGVLNDDGDESSELPPMLFVQTKGFDIRKACYNNSLLDGNIFFRQNNAASSLYHVTAILEQQQEGDNENDNDEIFRCLIRRKVDGLERWDSVDLITYQDEITYQDDNNETMKTKKVKTVLNSSTSLHELLQTNNDKNNNGASMMSEKRLLLRLEKKIPTSIENVF